MTDYSSFNTSTQSPTLSTQVDFSATIYLVGVCAGIFFLFIVLVIIVVAISMGVCRAAPVTPAAQFDASPSFADRLDEFEFDEQQVHLVKSTTEDSLTCPICLSNYQQSDICRKMPSPCLHIFHKRCIDKWFERSSDCPLCKRSIPKLLETENNVNV